MTLAVGTSKLFARARRREVRGERTLPPCYDCGKRTLRSECPLCGRTVCRACGEREGESCCGFANVVVLVPIHTVSEANQRSHWRTKAGRVKRQREAVELLLRTNATKPAFDRARVLLTRIAPKPLDTDNLQSAMKATRDQVAAWLGVDDGSDAVKWECAQERGATKTYAVRIEVWA